MKIKTKDDRRVRIQLRQRKRISGTTARPRLSVFRSVTHIYAQVIDDLSGKTLASALLASAPHGRRRSPFALSLRALVHFPTYFALCTLHFLLSTFYLAPVLPAFFLSTSPV